MVINDAGLLADGDLGCCNTPSVVFAEKTTGASDAAWTLQNVNFVLC